jgi:hypothetical protein
MLIFTYDTIFGIGFISLDIRLTIEWLIYKIYKILKPTCRHNEGIHVEYLHPVPSKPVIKYLQRFIDYKYQTNVVIW